MRYSGGGAGRKSALGLGPRGRGSPPEVPPEVDPPQAKDSPRAKDPPQAENPALSI